MMPRVGAMRIEAAFRDPEFADLRMGDFRQAIVESVGGGLTVENVYIQDVFVVGGRRLSANGSDDSPNSRRLQQDLARLQVDYIIIMDERLARLNNINPLTIQERLILYLRENTNRLFAARAASLGLSLDDVFVLQVLDVTLPDAYTATDLVSPPTRTITSTSTTKTTTTTSTSTSTTTTSSTSTTTSSTTTTTSIPAFIEDERSGKTMAAAINIVAFVVGGLCAVCCVARLCWKKVVRPQYGVAKIGSMAGFKDITLQWRYKKRRKTSKGEVVPDDGKRTLEWDIDVDVVAAQFLREFREDFEVASSARAPSEPWSRSNSKAPSEGDPEEGNASSDDDRHHVPVQAVSTSRPTTSNRANQQTADSKAFDVVTDGSLLAKKGSMWRQRQDNGESEESASLPDDDELENLMVFAMYEDGEPVEYYSRTHSRWLPAKVFVRSIPGTLVKEPQVIYTVEVNTGSRTQTRDDVQLDCLRRPFVDGDSVEVWNKDRWVDAHVEGTPSSLGITVVLTGAGGTELKQVAPGRVRRRFLSGDYVKVYMGPDVGFVPAEVDFEGTSEFPMELGAPLSGNIKSGSSYASSGTVGSGERSLGSNDTRRSSADCFWTLVPLKLEDELRPQWRPSYFVELAELQDM